MCARRETPNYDLLSYQRWTGEVLANRGCHEFICDDNNIGRLCVFVFSLYTRARPRSRLPPLQIFWRRWNFLRPRGHVYVHTFFFFTFSMRLKVGSRVEISRRYPRTSYTGNIICTASPSRSYKSTKRLPYNTHLCT